MIVNSQHGWHWPILDDLGPYISPEVWKSPAERVSELLGPDGEPLRIGFERNAIGFDLSPRRGK